MNTLYYLPGACSLATQVILREIGAPFSLVNRNDVADFSVLSPVGTVPVLKTGDQTLREGAAIILHLLENHANDLLPREGQARTKTIQNLMFANATVHPAYSKLFFISGLELDEAAKTVALKAAAQNVEKLWQVVEQELGESEFLGGEHVSPADILLTVFARWGAFFDVTIEIPVRVKQLLARVEARPSFQQALALEEKQAA